ncbi:hypothetical protein KK083_03700 [Fulvivirgaceae bacterium PWU4]|uniref:T9SS type A sorting domain-containing protein n=1 Tax=Chryseosolibacter histidini TaxID=2782349 RepID=A0AAP2DGV3_9BACT|nr:hypothetical protein [Chryseosolibacter histidini]MBT1695966.1 hypothetical protein [Chryseosolibacter histidini]
MGLNNQTPVKYSLMIFFPAVLLWSFSAMAQKKQNQDCVSECFQARVVSAESISGSCTTYELSISHNGDCRYALSHFTIAIPCGELSNAWNSQNWKQHIGLDPTTGLSGLKIDDIPGFGDGALREFRVRFTLCSTGACHDTLSCWEPVVAFKAATCVHYDTLDASCQPLKASLQKENVSCYGKADGTLSVNVESGKEPYSFLWSTGATASSITNVPAGIYTVTITDASGSALVLKDTVSQPSPIFINGTVTPASCSGAANGSITFAVSGGTAPYTYLWNNGNITAALQGLSAGNYTVTVTDGAGCQQSRTFTVSNQVQIIVSVAKNQPDCNSANGSIDLTTSGGTAPYHYEWSDGFTGEDRTNLTGGFYQVTVTDNAGCSTQTIINLTEINTLRLSATVTPASCQGDATGAIDLIVSGGTAPYSYEWTNGQTTEDLSGLPSGSYTVTVTDSKGCTRTIRVIVPKQTFLVPSQIIQPKCAGDGSTGTITLQQPSGGTSPYQYEWSTGDTGTTLSGLAPGTYSVIVTDATGCSRELYFVITAPQPLVASVKITNEQCSGNGSQVDLQVSGGAAPYSFHWSTGAVSEDLQNLLPGVYQVEITDANGCILTREVVIEGSSSSLTCLIEPVETMPLCGSQNNTLQTPVADAGSYSWRVESTDAAWSIIGSTSSASITYAAGSKPGSAVFWLTISKDGCTQTCSYTVSACVDNGGSDPGGEDPGGEDPDEDEPCGECFDSGLSIIKTEGACVTYEATIGTDGNCRHELSHWTIAIPCGDITALWNSEGWKMEIGKDPTTGLTGLKVDDIDGFGKENASFRVRFTVCRDTGCEWDPVVAYKAGLCVAYDTLSIAGSHAGVAVSAYPNPFADEINFEWTAADNGDSRLEILGRSGNPADVVFSGVAVKGTTYRHTWNASALPGGLYYFKLTTGSKTISGKIFRK